MERSRTAKADARPARGSSLKAERVWASQPRAACDLHGLLKQARGWRLRCGKEGEVGSGSGSLASPHPTRGLTLLVAITITEAYHLFWSCNSLPLTFIGG